MKENLITFEIAKLAKEKGFNIDCLHFYTKPNSKMFGIDEHNRFYPIKNISKKLYECGINAALNVECVYSAPTQSLLQAWLREKHNIHLGVWYNVLSRTYRIDYVIDAKKDVDIIEFSFDEYSAYSTYEECLEEALKIALNNIEI